MSVCKYRAFIFLDQPPPWPSRTVNTLWTFITLPSELRFNDFSVLLKLEGTLTLGKKCKKLYQVRIAPVHTVWITKIWKLSDGMGIRVCHKKRSVPIWKWVMKIVFKTEIISVSLNQCIFVADRNSKFLIFGFDILTRTWNETRQYFNTGKGQYSFSIYYVKFNCYITRCVAMNWTQELYLI